MTDITERLNKAKTMSFDIAVLSGNTAVLHEKLANPDISTGDALKAIREFHDRVFDSGCGTVAILALEEAGARRRDPRIDPRTKFEGLKPDFGVTDEAKFVPLAFHSDAKGG